MKLTLALFALAAFAQTPAKNALTDQLRLDLAMTQRDIRELERDFYNLRMQYDEQTRKITDKGKQLSEKMSTLKKQATEACVKQGKDFDEMSLACKDKAKNERSDK